MDRLTWPIMQTIPTPRSNDPAAAHSPPLATSGAFTALRDVPIAGTIGLVAVALALALFLREALTVANADLVFLLAVLGAAVIYGLWPSLLAALLSILLYNFFFVPPLFTFAVANPDNIIALATFGIVAVIAANLAARLRASVAAARERARATEELYLFARKLADAVHLDDILWVIAHQFARMLQVRVVVLMPKDGALQVKAGFPPEDSLSTADMDAAAWAWAHSRPAGREVDLVPGAAWVFLPMSTGRDKVGLVGLSAGAQATVLTPERRKLLTALIDQSAAAIERSTLAAEADRARLAAEGDKLRSALLASISHDLRTPLASILGAATTLRDHGDVLGQSEKDDLARVIQDGAERLNRFIANLLDMTKLESGGIALRLDVMDLTDLIGSSLTRAEAVLASHHVDLSLDPDLPMIKVDPVLFEQVLFNLLDNAAKYSGAGTTVTLRARHESEAVILEILDEGDGIGAGDEDLIFDKFYRARPQDSGRPGTGLGLAVARGFVEAMGGTIAAGKRSDGKGSIFTIRMPAMSAPESLP